MMDNGEFQFQNVYVVANGPTIFSKQLQKREIRFTLCTDKRDISGAVMPPDLIITVNKGHRRTVALKKRFPEAQVVECHGGGKKNFAPRISIIHGVGEFDYDVHWFADWDDFIGLVGVRQEPLPKIFEPVQGERNTYRVVLQPEQAAYSTDVLSSRFVSMLSASSEYLEWYLDWLGEVKELHFVCEFKFSHRRRRIRQVTIDLINDHTYRGLPVFNEEAMVTFFDDAGEEYTAAVQSIREEAMIIVFSKPLSRNEANNLVSYKREVGTGIAKAQQKLCESLHEGAMPTRPYRVICGDRPNTGAEPLETVYLTPDLMRKLLDDRSQSFALADILSDKPVVLIQGPAGTGKTFLASVGIGKFAMRGKFILLVSHSNKGLDNLIKFAAGSLGDPDCIFRLGNKPKNVTAAGIKFHRSRRFGEEENPVNAEAQRIRSLRAQDKTVILACTMASFLVDETLKALRESGELEIQIGFVDEASRGFLYELLPIVTAVAEKLILIGDLDQLGNIDIPPNAHEHLKFTLDEIGIQRFGDGWFNCALAEEWLPTSLLRINRRSLQLIGKLISHIFYKDQLIAGRFDPTNPGLVIFYDTKNAQDKNDDKRGKSYWNRREVNLMARLMVKRIINGANHVGMACIATYRAQVDKVRRKLRQLLFLDDRLELWREEVKLSNDNIVPMLLAMVNTVDAFQGSGRAEIYLSFVCSNDTGRIGFARNIRRLRVACTRAADRLVIVANSQTFLESDYPEVRWIFQELLKFVKEHGAYKEVE